MLKNWMRGLLTALLVVGVGTNELRAAAVAWVVPTNGLSSPALPGNPVSGTGNPNGTTVTTFVYHQAPGATGFTLIDAGWVCGVSSNTWSTTMQSGNNNFTAKGTYRCTASMPSYPRTSDVSTCTVP